MHAPLDVLCAGLVVADHVCAPIARIPPAGTLILTEKLDITIGGCAANTATDLAKLGVRNGIVGRIGDDPLGQIVKQSLVKQGVDVRHLSVSQTAQTAATLVVNVEREDRRFIHAVGANAEFTGQELTEDHLQNVRVLCVGGFGLNDALSGENVAGLFRRARAAGVMTMLDIVISDSVQTRKMLEPVLPLTDLFLPNQDEAAMLLGETDPVLQAQHFRSAGAAAVIVTSGVAGLTFANSEGIWQMLAHPVKQVDGTGGGDAFVAGYILGILENRPLAERLAYGVALGASCVQSMGATTGVFDHPTLVKFVAEHPLPLNRIEKA